MASDQTKSGHRLGTFIESLGISKKEFTRRTGLDYAHLHKITTGSNDPGFETCCKISEAYPELSLTWLITGEGEMKNISREERNDIQRVKAWRDENATDTSAVLYLFKTEHQDNKSLISSLRHKGVFDDGFHILILPQIAAIKAFQAHTATGKLNAEIIPTMPNG